METLKAIVWLAIWGGLCLVFGWFTLTVSLKAGALVTLGLIILIGLLGTIADTLHRLTGGPR